MYRLTYNKHFFKRETNTYIRVYVRERESEVEYLDAQICKYIIPNYNSVYLCQGYRLQVLVVMVKGNWNFELIFVLCFIFVCK